MNSKYNILYQTWLRVHFILVSNVQHSPFEPSTSTTAKIVWYHATSGVVLRRKMPSCTSIIHVCTTISVTTVNHKRKRFGLSASEKLWRAHMLHAPRSEIANQANRIELVCESEYEACIWRVMQWADRVQPPEAELHCGLKSHAHALALCECIVHHLRLCVFCAF